MKKKSFKKENPVVVYAADFETTTDNSEKVEVWSAAEIEVGFTCPAAASKVHHQSSMKGFIQWVEDTAHTFQCDLIIYFHNLKFDGSYILDFLGKAKKYRQYLTHDAAGIGHLLVQEKTPEEDMPQYTYTYTVSSKNVMYGIVLKCGGYTVRFLDSMKLLPFSLRKIAEDFGTKHQKLEMDYGHKHPGYQPTKAELEYINNDVFVLKEALEIFSQLTMKPIEKLPMTIGQQAMEDFCITENLFSISRRGKVKVKSGERYEKLFPSMIQQIEGAGKEVTYDDYIRASYKGGWCYVNPAVQGKVLSCPGYVYDVNSLYPSMMHSISGCFYPCGKAHFHKGAPTEAEEKGYHKKKVYYFIHVKMKFHVKHNHFPCIQIKSSPAYDGTQWLETSVVTNKVTGEKIDVPADLYLTCTDWELIKEQYDLSEVKILSTVTFSTFQGLFDRYIDKWMKVKMESEGAKRAFAKLLLNNLYGKFSTSPVADYQWYKMEDGKVRYATTRYTDEDRAVYIPVGSAITSWARNFTIRHAQKNFFRFCYADTDSLHMTGKYTEAKGIMDDKKKLCCWKNESTWDKAIFAGQKRYIEHVTEDTREAVEPFDSIKCCGLGKGAKARMEGWLKDGKLSYADFKKGLIVPGNLKGRVVQGGTFLMEGDFHFR